MAPKLHSKWISSSKKDFIGTYLEILQWLKYCEPNTDLQPASGFSLILCTGIHHSLRLWWRPSPAGRLPSPLCPALCCHDFLGPQGSCPAAECHPAPCQLRAWAWHGSERCATSSRTEDALVHLSCREGWVALLPTHLAAWWTQPRFLLWITGFRRKKWFK